MFTKPFGKYVCEGDSVTCEVDGFTCTATVYRDDDTTPPDERQDGFWPSLDSTDAGFITPNRGESDQAALRREMALAEKVIAAWKKDEWFYCGVAVTVERCDVPLTGKYANALWGVECNYPDSGNSYLLEVANEMLGEALEQARAKVTEICKA